MVLAGSARLASVLGLLTVLCACAEHVAGTGSTTGDTGGGAGGALQPVALTYSATHDGGGVQQVWVAAADGSDAHTITTGFAFPTGSNDEPSLSPDGKTIVFASGRDFPEETDVQPPAGFTAPRMIYTMRSDGTEAKRLTNETPAGWPSGPPLGCSEHTPRFSPDGALVVFARVCMDDPVSSSADQLFVIHADGSGLERLINPSDAAGLRLSDAIFAADSAHVLFVSDADNPDGEIYSVDIATHAIVRLTISSTGGARYPVLSRDGTRIFFLRAAASSTATELASMNADGTGASSQFTLPVFTAPEMMGFPRYSRFAATDDPARIGFVASDDITSCPLPQLCPAPLSRITTANLDETGPTSVSAPFVFLGVPSWR